jgi:ABC-type hemin transport system substrate-binding protein
MSNQFQNAEKIQNVINSDLFPVSAPQIADVKQVLAFMEDVAQPISETQLRAIILLEHLGNNKQLHDKNPYTDLIKKIQGDYKKLVAHQGFYLETIEALVPKAPKPVIMSEKSDKGGK